MSTFPYAAGMFPISIMLLGGTMALGQDFPNRSIRLVAPGPGGNSDFAARLIAQELTVPLSQQVIVDNRAAGIIPGEIVYRSPPDGYTLLVSGNNLWITPLLQKTPYDPVRDFSPISYTNRQPNVLVVHPSVSMAGIFAPGGTPSTIINRLNQEIVRVLNSTEVKEKFLSTGSEPVGSSPEQLAATVKSEMARLGKVIKDAGIRAD